MAARSLVVANGGVRSSERTWRPLAKVVLTVVTATTGAEAVDVAGVVAVMDEVVEEETVLSIIPRLPPNKRKALHDWLMGYETKMGLTPDLTSTKRVGSHFLGQLQRTKTRYWYHKIPNCLV